MNGAQGLAAARRFGGSPTVWSRLPLSQELSTRGSRVAAGRWTSNELLSVGITSREQTSEYRTAERYRVGTAETSVPHALVRPVFPGQRFGCGNAGIIDMSLGTRRRGKHCASAGCLGVTHENSSSATVRALSRQPFATAGPRTRMVAEWLLVAAKHPHHQMDHSFLRSDSFATPLLRSA